MSTIFFFSVLLLRGRLSRFCFLFFLGSTDFLQFFFSPYLLFLGRIHEQSRESPATLCVVHGDDTRQPGTCSFPHLPEYWHKPELPPTPPVSKRRVWSCPSPPMLYGRDTSRFHDPMRMSISDLSSFRRSKTEVNSFYFSFFFSLVDRPHDLCILFSLWLYVFLPFRWTCGTTAVVYVSFNAGISGTFPSCRQVHSRVATSFTTLLDVAPCAPRCSGVPDLFFLGLFSDECRQVFFPPL